MEEGLNIRWYLGRLKEIWCPGPGVSYEALVPTSRAERFFRKK
jgi:hypothetical protein